MMDAERTRDNQGCRRSRRGTAMGQPAPRGQKAGRGGVTRMTSKEKAGHRACGVTGLKLHALPCWGPSNYGALPLEE